MEELTVKVDGKEHKVLVEETQEGKVIVHHGNETYEVETKKDAISSIMERLQNKSAEGDVSEIRAPLPGSVYEIKVKGGDDVKQGQSLFSLMAMKMENNITAPRDCRIKEIKVKKNDSVSKGDVLAIIE